MNGDVHSAPVFVSQLLRKSPDELGTALRVELLRQNHHYFPTQLRVAASSTLYRIPKRGPVLSPRDFSVSCEFGRDKNFFVDNIIPS